MWFSVHKGMGPVQRELSLENVLGVEVDSWGVPI